MDRLHGGKLEHNHRPRIVIAFEDFDLRASRGEFAAEAGDERNDRFAVLRAVSVVGRRRAVDMADDRLRGRD